MGMILIALGTTSRVALANFAFFSRSPRGLFVGCRLRFLGADFFSPSFLFFSFSFSHFFRSFFFASLVATVSGIGRSWGKKYGQKVGCGFVWALVLEQILPALVEGGSYLEKALLLSGLILCVVWFSGLGWCGDKVELLSCFALGTDGGGKGVEMAFLS